MFFSFSFKRASHPCFSKQWHIVQLDNMYKLSSKVSLLLPPLKGSFSCFISQNTWGNNRTSKIMEDIWKEFWFHNIPTFHYNSQHLIGIQHNSFSTGKCRRSRQSFLISFTHWYSKFHCELFLLYFYSSWFFVWNMKNSQVRLSNLWCVLATPHIIVSQLFALQYERFT